MSSLSLTVNIFFRKRLYRPILGKAVELASFNWQSYPEADDIVLQRMAQEKPMIAVVSCEWLSHGAETLVASIRQVSPFTHVVLCYLQETIPTQLLNSSLVDVDPDAFCHLSELTNCLQTIRAGQSFVSAFWHSDLTAFNSTKHLPGWQNLSRQEQKIIGLMAQGLKGPDIADNLFISKKTVNNHKLKISQKLNITGGPGSLTRFVLTEHQSITQLLSYQPSINIA